ncbi:MAG: BrxA/BrxB family bacilliredoxin [Acidobacteria bacterium]|nr:BrxA/BrxB family bacilliredoxin [Acidobacteriota bacterium]
MVEPMREELARVGVKELRTAEEVEALMNEVRGKTVMIVVNSVCGCAAGKARPGIIQALQHLVKPDIVATVFAGQDLEATARARSYFSEYPPSSPSVALWKDGKAVFMLQRFQIEGREAPEIAQILTAAFDRYCAKN